MIVNGKMNKETGDNSNDYGIHPNVRKKRTTSTESNKIRSKLCNFFSSFFNEADPKPFIDTFFPKNSSGECDGIKGIETLPDGSTKDVFIRLTEIPADVLKHVCHKLKTNRGTNKAAHIQKS